MQIDENHQLASVGKKVQMCAIPFRVAPIRTCLTQVLLLTFLMEESFKRRTVRQRHRLGWLVSELATTPSIASTGGLPGLANRARELAS